MSKDLIRRREGLGVILLLPVLFKVLGGGGGVIAAIAISRFLSPAHRQRFLTFSSSQHFVEL